MPAEAIRCIDCNAPLKAVPSWLKTASVRFTCTNCPKKPSRGLPPRPEAAPEVRARATDDDDTELDDVEVEMDDDADMEDVVIEDADEAGDAGDEKNA